MKKAAIVLGLLLAVLGIAFLWLHNNLDTLVKNAIEKYGSQMTGTKVHVASVEIRAAEGTGIVRGFVVGNPAGFRTPYALKVGEIEIVLDIASIAKPVVIVKKIVVSAPDVIYEQANGTTNFDAIRKHIAEQGGSSGEKVGEKKGGKKLIIGRLSQKRLLPPDGASDRIRSRGGRPGKRRLGQPQAGLYRNPRIPLQIITGFSSSRKRINDCPGTGHLSG